MSIRIRTLLGCVLLLGWIGYAHATTVDNVSFSQSTDGSKIVTVQYTLSGDTSAVNLDLSVDAGNIWASVSPFCTGDLGASVAPGDHVITFDLGSWGSIFTQQAQFRVVAEPRSFVPFLGPPQPSQNTLYVGVPVNLRVIVPIAPYPALLPGQVVLWEVTETGELIAALGVMYDDGNLGHGDEILGDGIYSMITTMQRPSVGPFFLAVRAASQEADGLRYTLSPLCSMNTVASINPEAAGQTAQAILDANAEYLALVDELGPEQALQQIVDWLEARPEVTSATISESGDIWIEYDNGLNGMILAFEEGILGSSGTSARGSEARIPLGQQTIGNWIQTHGQRTSDNEIQSNNILLYAPIQSQYINQWNCFLNDDIYDMFADSNCPIFNVNYLTNQYATVNALNDIADYGLIAINTHGGIDGEGQVIFQSGELFNPLSPLIDDWILGRVTLTPHYTGDYNVWTVRPSYISSRNGTMPGSIIYNGYCHSAQNSTMVNAFISKGAGAFVGFNQSIDFRFNADVAPIFFESIIEGETTQEAFIPGQSDPYYHLHANFVMLPAYAERKFASSLANPGFEEGNLSGWTADGDGRVISQLGFLTPTEGSYMAIISTGLGYSTSSATISQSFCLPDSINTLSCNWNYLSEELIEYVGSVYQDYFNITLVDENGGSHTLLHRTVDDIYYNYGLIHVSPNIVFDQGDVWMTGWVPFEFDISPWAGQTVELIFATGDVGDSIYDTAILIDDIVTE